jgi:CRISPR/Cas system-associated protein Cas7 (RAMP superfamily)
LIAFYEKQPFAKNFPVGKEKVYYPPKTSSHYSFTFDMDKDYVPVFENIDEYLDGFKQDKARFSSMVKHYAKPD